MTYTKGVPLRPLDRRSMESYSYTSDTYISEKMRYTVEQFRPVNLISPDVRAVILSSLVNSLGKERLDSISEDRLMTMGYLAYPLIDLLDPEVNKRCYWHIIRDKDNPKDVAGVVMIHRGARYLRRFCYGDKEAILEYVANVRDISKKLFRNAHLTETMKHEYPFVFHSKDFSDGELDQLGEEIGMSLKPDRQTNQKIVKVRRYTLSEEDFAIKMAEQHITEENLISTLNALGYAVEELFSRKILRNNKKTMKMVRELLKHHPHPSTPYVDIYRRRHHIGVLKLNGNHTMVGLSGTPGFAPISAKEFLGISGDTVVHPDFRGKEHGNIGRYVSLLAKFTFFKSHPNYPYKIMAADIESTNAPMIGLTKNMGYTEVPDSEASWIVYQDTKN